VRRLEAIARLDEQLELQPAALVADALAAGAEGQERLEVREAAERAANGEAPRDAFWLFRAARDRCLEASEQGLQAEDVDLEEHEVAPWAASQIERLDANQLAIWISSAPDPQRTALALFYLDEFSHSDLLALTELKPDELAKAISNGRQQFQGWLNTTVPHTEP